MFPNVATQLKNMFPFSKQERERLHRPRLAAGTSGAPFFTGVSLRRKQIDLDSLRHPFPPPKKAQGAPRKSPGLADWEQVGSALTGPP